MPIYAYQAKKPEASCEKCKGGFDLRQIRLYNAHQLAKSKKAGSAADTGAGGSVSVNSGKEDA